MPYVAGGDWAAVYEDREDCGCGFGSSRCCGAADCPACHPVGETESDVPISSRPRRSRSEGMGMYDRGGYGGFSLLSYGYKPAPLWKGGDGGEPGLPYYGMEIEISCGRTDTMAWAAENFGTDLVYLKSDGSVHGFEMVTHPMTFPWALENFPWQHLPTLKTKGCSIDPGSNGIHVHVSRKGFNGDAHTLRWFKLLYRNKDNVIRIARRDSRWGTFTVQHQRGQMAHLKNRKGLLDAANHAVREQIRGVQSTYQSDLREAERAYRQRQRDLSAQYDAAYEIRGDDDRRDREVNQVYEGERQNQADYRAIRATLEAASNNRIAQLRRNMLEDTTTARYSAINTNPNETFEVRAFASTLDPVTAQSTIGLVAASVEYTRKLTSHEIIHNDALKWPAFAGWLAEQPLYAAVKYANDNAVNPHPPRSVI